MESIKRIFTDQGGVFCISKKELLSKLTLIKAFVFDWDGVFNNGVKHREYGSSFSDVDAMGVNMLRFSRYLQKSRMPIVAIMSGEGNDSAVSLAQRDYFNAVYLHAKNKKQALDHFLKTYALNAGEVAFVFDDVLDIPIAKICGLRCLVNRNGSPLFKKYVKDNALADYVTANKGEGHAVREVCELFMGLSGQYSAAIGQRILFSDRYRAYLSNRKRTNTSLYTLDDDAIKVRLKK